MGSFPKGCHVAYAMTQIKVSTLTRSKRWNGQNHFKTSLMDALGQKQKVAQVMLPNWNNTVTPWNKGYEISKQYFQTFRQWDFVQSLSPAFLFDDQTMKRWPPSSPLHPQMRMKIEAHVPNESKGQALGVMFNLPEDTLLCHCSM